MYVFSNYIFMLQKVSKAFKYVVLREQMGYFLSGAKMATLNHSV
jgi:hypothetical protein